MVWTGMVNRFLKWCLFEQLIIRAIFISVTSESWDNDRFIIEVSFFFSFDRSILGCFGFTLFPFYLLCTDFSIETSCIYMLKLISSAIKFAHTLVITYLCVQICSQKSRIQPQAILLEIGFTILSLLISRKHFFDVLQVVISLFLTYSLIPNNYSFLVGLFFFKIIYVANVLGEVLEDLFATTGNNFTRLLKILISLLRYTIVEYLFLGLVLLGYKMWTLNDPEGTVPEDYIILYKLIVTATTIGYGDITPKTKHQITYFTYMIPFICASFVLYFNAVIPILTQLTDLILGNSENITAEAISEGSKLPSFEIWTQKEKQSFKTFAQEVARRTAEDEQQQKKLGNNWIAISAANYEKQVPLLNEILRGDEPKQIKIKISSKVRKTYFPAGWTILQAGDLSEDLMMIDQGQVVAETKLTKGAVLNRDGCLKGAASKISIKANSFVAMWVVSRKDLQQASKTSQKVQEILAQAAKN